MERSRGLDPAASNGGQPLLEVRELRYFAALADELHFSRAAERLHISQPPLSQTIANLERKLGTRLLERTSRQARLTAAGAVLRDHALQVLVAIEEAVAATRAAASAESETLRVAAAVTVGETVLPQLLYGLALRFPALAVDVTEEIATDVLTRVLQGDADLGIVICAARTRGLRSHVVRREQPAAVFHQTHALASEDTISLEELAELPMLVWPREESAGAYDFVLSLFAETPPASVTTLERFDARWWKEMIGGAFTVAPVGASLTPDFAIVPIADAQAEFVTEIVWSDQAPPTLLPALLTVADEVATEEGWVGFSRRAPT